MDSDRFEHGMRAREWYHGLRLLPRTWAVLRVDGRSFSKFTAERFDKPFDEVFAKSMQVTAMALMEDLHGVYGYTESDEISIVLPPSYEMFDRSVEKLVSISAGIASSAFSIAVGERAHFDSRIWLGGEANDVVDYMSWRQADAGRCCLNGWSYWTLRKEGLSAGAATSQLRNLPAQRKHDLLHERGINFNDLPLWQRRGTGIWQETFMKEGFNPKTNEKVTVSRKRLRVDEQLPLGDEYRAALREHLAAYEGRS